MNEYPIQDIEFRVEELAHFNDALFLLSLTPFDTAALPLPTVLPGQFVQILIPDCSEVFLRRPISIYRSTASHLYLLIQRVGKGTERLSRVRVGETMRILMPLGNGFGHPVGKRPLLVGGGVGIAPLLMQGEWLSSRGLEPTYLLGARSARLFGDLEPFRSSGRLFTTTEDASMGERGYVTDHTILTSETFTDIYTCGPTPMMKAVVRWAKEHHVRCQVSLENLMGCGMGVCLCCVEPTVTGHRTVCTEGPVFDMNDLLW